MILGGKNLSILWRSITRSWVSVLYYFLWISPCSQGCRYQAAGCISTRLNAHFNTTVNPFGGNKTKIQRLWEALLTVSRIQGKGVTCSRGGKLSTEMDPKQAPLPELAQKNFIVFLSVFRRVYSFSSLLLYPQSMWRAFPTMSVSTYPSADWNESWLIRWKFRFYIRLKHGCFIPFMQKEDRPLSLSSRIRAGYNSCENTWLYWSPAPFLPLLSISL